MHHNANDTSMQITQKLEGLPPESVDIEGASHMVVIEFTIGPGAVFPWHTHPGTVPIKVVQADFMFVLAEDCVERDLDAGSAVVDPDDTVHTGWTPDTEDETVVAGTLLCVPAEVPLANTGG